MSGNVLVVGSVNYDMIYNVAQLPKRHETVPAMTFNTAPGGKGSNQAAACAVSTPSAVTLLGCVGEDMYAENCKAYLQGCGVEVSRLQALDSAPMGTACVLVNEVGDNLIVVSAGANGHVSPAHVDAADELFASADIALFQLEVPMETVKRSLELARVHKTKTILNPAPYIAGAETLIPFTDVFTPNQTEAASLTGVEVNDEASALKAAQAIGEMGCDTVVITLGGEGSLVVTEAGFKHIAPYKAQKVVDTTGAGDVYNGVLAGMLADGADIFEAAKCASAAASISVTRASASYCAPSQAELAAFLKTVN